MLSGNSRSRSATVYRPGWTTYFRRIIKPKQMDFEYTFWVMLQLCISPKTVYRHTAYHKQTKNQWARDDPAFVVVCSVLVAVAAAAYCITFGDSLWHSMLTILSAVAVDFLLLGCAVATAGWLISNNFLLKRNLQQHQVEQRVEWLYSFDVHCNSYFPLFLLLYVLQFFLSPLLLWNSLLSSALSAALYAGALTYYHYMTFLGYSALPFLERTEIVLTIVLSIVVMMFLYPAVLRFGVATCALLLVFMSPVFLWPIGAIFLCIPFVILANFNAARFTLSIYFG